MRDRSNNSYLKEIKNVNDLHRFKNLLKEEMKTSPKFSKTNNSKNALLSDNDSNNLVNKIFNIGNASLATYGVEKTFSWLGKRVSKKFPMLGLSKIIIPGIIFLSVPIVAKKIQEYVENKL